MADENLDALAGEYVLGTLDGAERASAAQTAAKDSNFAARIAAWEQRLGPLEAMVNPIDPPSEVWISIRSAFAEARPQSAVRLPELAPATTSADTKRAVVPSRALWPWLAVGITGLVAVLLAIVIALSRLQPDALPIALQPPVREHIVQVTKEVPAPQPPPQPAPPSVAAPSPPPIYSIGVLQRDPDAPAFLLIADVDKRKLTVHRLIGPPEDGKSYQLWLVSKTLPAPRSLGLINDEFSTPAIADYDAATIKGAMYAVSLEAAGSPNSAPTGRILFTGKLVDALPTPASAVKP